MGMYFVLDERGEPQRERDLDTWSRWFERADRRIARTVVSADVTVLTTFTGVDDLAQEGDQPRLFATRIFGGVLNGEEMLRHTRDEALATHAWLVEWCRIGNAPGCGVTEDSMK
jgi:hypothetical protein